MLLRNTTTLVMLVTLGIIIDMAQARKWHSGDRKGGGPGPHSYRSRGYIYAQSPSPEPPILGKGHRRIYPLSRRQLPKIPPFLHGFLGKSSRDYTALFPEKIGTRMRPTYAFQWGGGGGGGGGGRG